MKKVTTISEMQKVLNRIRQAGKPIRLIPTMGYLHQGHLKLVETAKRAGGFVVVSIFVNPTQFGPKEDFKKYPRDLKKDQRLLQKAGVDLLFCPTSKEMYPEGMNLSVSPGKGGAYWCGAFRNGHFAGVLTIVAKLFQIIAPEAAYFGQKDYQQLFLIKQMAKELHFKTKVVGVPTVREPDGLALSSRNHYLSKQERMKALTLFEALKEVRAAILKGEKRASSLNALLKKQFQNGIKLQYAGMASSKDLTPVQKVKKGDVVLLAAFVGKTRLIDNWIVGDKL